MLELAVVCAAAALAGCVDAIAGGGGLIQVPALFAVYPREVLIRMEWDSWGYDPYGEGRAHCPCCGWTKDEGHAPDCALHAALAAKE